MNDDTRRPSRARVPFGRRLSTLAAVAAILVLGVPLVSYYMLRPTVREAEDAAGDVMLVSPRGDLRAVQPVTLVWRSVPSAEQYEVTIVGDDSTRVARETTRDTTLVVRAAVPAGRDYHWSVVAHLTSGGEARSEPVRFRFDAP